MDSVKESVKVEATPRPWGVNRGDFAPYGIEGPTGEVVAYMGDAGYAPDRDRVKANAELIVRAVNAHDELVEAAEQALHDLEFAEASDGRLGMGWKTTLHALREALAKAKGESHV